MSSLSWDSFQRLSGAPQKNFEILCRGLIRLNYESFGEFRATANMPGVEFSLKLKKDCGGIGSARDWIGWQCKYYDIQSGTPIGVTRRRQIEEGIRSAEKYFSGMTDWILWTKYPLTKGDQVWFYKIKTSMRLRLHSADEIINYLAGNATLLRGVYFGEFTLNKDSIGKSHNLAIQPIKERWNPEVHQVLSTERSIRQMLGQVDTKKIERQLKRLGTLTLSFEKTFATVPELLKIESFELNKNVDLLVENVKKVVLSANEMSFSELNASLDACKAISFKRFRPLPRLLRNFKNPSALIVTNLLSEGIELRNSMNEFKKLLSRQCIVITGKAGEGKTEIAAAITSPIGDRPAGLLVLGKTLKSRDSLNDLFADVLRQEQKTLQSAEAIFAAMNTLGEAVSARLPLVIDGLNESEDPRMWKDILRKLIEILKDYPYILLVVTIRPNFVKDSIPSDLPVIKLDGFGADFYKAVKKYFKYFKIEKGDSDVPEFLKHPLSLKMFCEVANPSRKKVVSMDSVPKSMDAIFEKFVSQSSDRISELSHLSQRFVSEDVASALGTLAKLLWNGKANAVSEAKYRKAIGDESRPWTNSMVFALEQEGLILRDPTSGGGYHIYPVYDAFAGYLIADGLVKNCGFEKIVEKFKEEKFMENFSSASENRQALNRDIFIALASRFPKLCKKGNLWKFVDGKFKEAAIDITKSLDYTLLDKETITEIETVSLATPKDFREFIREIFKSRAVVGHPFNADYLNKILKPMAVAERDLKWTEQIRIFADDYHKDLLQLQKKWKAVSAKSAEDDLRSTWVKWCLTCPDNRLRDQATKTLYWYGSGNPSKIFEMAIDSLNINDLYLAERLFAVCYGLVNRFQNYNSKFESALIKYLKEIDTHLLAKGAIAATDHWLIRYHVKRIFKFAKYFYPNAIPGTVSSPEELIFADGPDVELIDEDHPYRKEIESIFNMDFENYTLGSLCSGRNNYDMKHAGHRYVSSYVLGVAWELGWRSSTFAQIDRDMRRDYSRAERPKLERYGKKYSWIGFFRCAGILEKKGQLRERGLAELHIDPTFPESARINLAQVPNWSKLPPKEGLGWIKKTEIKIPAGILYSGFIKGEKGPWVLAEAHLSNGNYKVRNVWLGIKACLIDNKDKSAFSEFKDHKKFPMTHDFLSTPSDYYTFGGEISWNNSSAYSDSEWDENSYRQEIILDGSKVEIETLTLHFAWESYHSELNKEGGAYVPSPLLSKELNLRSIPGSLSQMDSNGETVSISLTAEGEVTGHLLYIRKKELSTYAKGKSLVWVAYGEKQIMEMSGAPSEELMKVMRNQENGFRYIIDGPPLK